MKCPEMVSLCTKGRASELLGHLSEALEGFDLLTPNQLCSERPGSWCPCTRDFVIWKMFAGLICENWCAVVWIFSYLVASEVERFLIFLFISFVSSFMYCHFVFFPILCLISPISLFFSTPY